MYKPGKNDFKYRYKLNIKGNGEEKTTLKNSPLPKISLKRNDERNTS